jgi:hypothetical protein
MQIHTSNKYITKIENICMIPANHPLLFPENLRMFQASRFRQNTSARYPKLPSARTLRFQRSSNALQVHSRQAVMETQIQLRQLKHFPHPSAICQRCQQVQTVVMCVYKGMKTTISDMPLLPGGATDAGSETFADDRSAVERVIAIQAVEPPSVSCLGLRAQDIHSA